MNLPNDYGPADFLTWVHDPLTKAFLQSLADDRLAIMQAWARKQFVGDNADQTNFLNARALAKLETIDEILLNVEESAEEARQTLANKEK